MGLQAWSLEVCPGHGTSIASQPITPEKAVYCGLGLSDH